MMDDAYLFYNTQKPFNVSTTHHVINTLLQLDDELKSFTNGILSVRVAFPERPVPINITVAASELKDLTSINLNVVLCRHQTDEGTGHTIYSNLFRISIRQFSKFTEYHADKFPDRLTKLTAKSNVEWRTLLRSYLRESNLIPAITYGMETN